MPTDLIRSVALSSAELWNDVLQRLGELQDSQVLLAQAVSELGSLVHSSLGNRPPALASVAPPALTEPSLLSLAIASTASDTAEHSADQDDVAPASARRGLRRRDGQRKDRAKPARRHLFAKQAEPDRSAQLLVEALAFAAEVSVDTHAGLDLTPEAPSNALPALPPPPLVTPPPPLQVPPPPALTSAAPAEAPHALVYTPATVETAFSGPLAALELDQPLGSVYEPVRSAEADAPFERPLVGAGVLSAAHSSASMATEILATAPRIQVPANAEGEPSTVMISEDLTLLSKDRKRRLQFRLR